MFFFACTRMSRVVKVVVVLESPGRENVGRGDNLSPDITAQCYVDPGDKCRRQIRKLTDSKIAPRGERTNTTCAVQARRPDSRASPNIASVAANRPLHVGCSGPDSHACCHYLGLPRPYSFYCLNPVAFLRAPDLPPESDLRERRSARRSCPSYRSQASPKPSGAKAAPFRNTDAAPGVVVSVPPMSGRGTLWKYSVGGSHLRLRFFSVVTELLQAENGMLRIVGHTRRGTSRRGCKLSSCFIRSLIAAIRDGNVGTLSLPASALHRFDFVPSASAITGRTLIDGSRDHISSRSTHAVLCLPCFSFSQCLFFPFLFSPSLGALMASLFPLNDAPTTARPPSP